MVDSLTDQTLPGYYDKLVGDGRKYAEKEALAKGYINADLHIKTLEEELAELRQKNNRLEQRTDEVLEQMKNSGNTDLSGGTAPVAPPANKPTVTPEEIEKMVSSAISKQTDTQTKKTNMDRCFDMLIKHYGTQEKALEAINKVHSGEQSKKDVLDLAATSNPEFAFRMVVGEAPKPNASRQTPLIDDGGSADAIVSSNSQLTWSQASKVRKENPSLYRSPEFRLQLEQAAAEAHERGVDFYAT